MVPVNYVTENRPSFSAWDEQTMFKQKLAEYYTHPIFEALVIYTDEKGETNAYLSQIAYDRYHIVNDRLDVDKFYGWILKANWDDTLLGGSFYEEGKQQLSIHPSDANARITDCRWYYYSYYSYSGGSCGVNCYEFTITLHQHYSVSCSGGSPGGSGSWEEYPYEVPEGGEGSGGSGPIYVPSTTNYNLRNVLCNPSGSDRQNLISSMGNALAATGLGSSITGWSFNKAEAILRSAGSAIDDFRPLTTAGRTFGIAGGVLGGMRGVVGLFDGNVSDHDALDIIGGVIGVGLALSPAGWIGVVAGGAVTLGIAIYEANNQPISIYDFCN